MKTRPAEKFFLDRRRRKETQTEAATRIGVSRAQISRYENGDSPAPDVNGFELTNVEQCVVSRRRKGWTMAKLAKLIGCSRYRIIMMERADWNPTLLIDYWA